MQVLCFSRFGIYKEYARWSIFWLKAPSQTLSEIFAPQDCTIKAAPGFMGPTNMYANRTPVPLLQIGKLMITEEYIGEQLPVQQNTPHQKAWVSQTFT